tara:strand:- start:31602 stop:32078 length:477 start_codon:yes stop_codon:yes gene_type:complete
MSFKKSILLSALATAILLATSSCKKCTVAESNEETGIIIAGAIIYPKSGYITADSGTKLFNGTGQYANSFEVSFDGGQTRIPVDYGMYDILANPMTIKCKASVIKDVKYDAGNAILRYKATATTCKSCEEERYIENYVLIPKITAGATVWFEPIVNEN